MTHSPRRSALRIAMSQLRMRHYVNAWEWAKQGLTGREPKRHRRYRMEWIEENRRG